MLITIFKDSFNICAIIKMAKSNSGVKQSNNRDALNQNKPMPAIQDVGLRF